MFNPISAITSATSLIPSVLGLGASSSSSPSTSTSSLLGGSIGETSILPWPDQKKKDCSCSGMLQMFQMMMQVLLQVIEKLAGALGSPKAEASSSVSSPIASAGSSSSPAASSATAALPGSTTSAATGTNSSAAAASSTTPTTATATQASSSGDGIIGNLSTLLKSIGELLSGKLTLAQANEQVAQGIGSVLGSQAQGAYQLASNVVGIAFDWGKEILGATILRPFKLLSKVGKGVSKGLKLLKKLF